MVYSDKAVYGTIWDLATAKAPPPGTQNCLLKLFSIRFSYIGLTTSL